MDIRGAQQGFGVIVSSSPSNNVLPGRSEPILCQKVLSPDLIELRDCGQNGVRVGHVASASHRDATLSEMAAADGASAVRQPTTSLPNARQAADVTIAAGGESALGRHPRNVVAGRK